MKMDRDCKQAYTPMCCGKSQTSQNSPTFFGLKNAKLREQTLLTRYLQKGYAKGWNSMANPTVSSLGEGVFRQPPCWDFVMNVPRLTADEWTYVGPPEMGTEGKTRHHPCVCMQLGSVEAQTNCNHFACGTKPLKHWPCVSYTLSS
mmetsp:Transcript_59116/g.95608  ORF Transcript_59116/g.95608 Transcript_59116/m.95608 type:complete len:146 (-) Transcript_59116:2583-3020(-)